MTSKTNKPSTFAQRQKAATSAETTVHLCLDLQLHARYAQVYGELERLELQKRGDDDSLSTLDEPGLADQVRAKMQEVVDAGQAIQDASELYTFRKTRRQEWKAIGDEHPPTKDQQNDGLDVDPDGFWPEAISAASAMPKLSVDDVLWLRDGDEDGDWTGLPASEFDRLVKAVRDLHVSGGALPKGSRDIAAILKHGLNGTTPANAASPSASSVAGSQSRANPTG